MSRNISPFGAILQDKSKHSMTGKMPGKLVSYVCGEMIEWIGYEALIEQ